jgi:cbb3-type cytochrome oxidase maturation protein
MLMTGASIAQAIPILISPLLTRLYSPEDFGLAASYAALAAVIAVLATSSYEQAIVLPENDTAAVNLMVLCGAITLAITLLTLAVVVGFNQPIAAMLGSETLAVWLYLVPLSVLLQGIYQTFSLWKNRTRQYDRLAGGQVSQSLTTAIASLLAGLGPVGAGGLILARILGQAIGTGVLAWPRRGGIALNTARISKQAVVAQAVRYKNFPKYTMPQGLLDGFRDSGTMLLISFFFDAHILGLYVLVMRVLRTPLSLIGSSIAQVFYREASQVYNSGQALWPLQKRLLLSLIKISLPIFLGVVLVGPLAFPLIFGPKWVEAGTYLQVLAPWIFINFISSPISQIPFILNKQREFLFVGVGYNVLIPLAFLLFSQVSHDPIKVFAAISLTASLYLIGVIIWIAKISRQQAGSFSTGKGQIDGI